MSDRKVIEDLWPQRLKGARLRLEAAQLDLAEIMRDRRDGNHSRTLGFVAPRATFSSCDFKIARHERSQSWPGTRPEIDTPGSGQSKGCDIRLAPKLSLFAVLACLTLPITASATPVGAPDSCRF